MLRRFISSLLPKYWHPTSLIARHIIRRTGGTVTSGPFKGLMLFEPSWNAHAAKMIGVYEREIYACLERMHLGSGWQIVNIGAADGYYACGLARWSSISNVYAFEMDGRSRELLKRNAHLNQVESKIHIKGACTPEALEDVLKRSERPTLIFCDVEGYEDILLDPDAHPTLVQCHLLVEVHELLSAGVSNRLQERFSKTHEIVEIQPEPRHRSEFTLENPWTSLLKDFYITSAISDGRPSGIFWQMMTPHSSDLA